MESDGSLRVRLEVPNIAELSKTYRRAYLHCPEYAVPDSEVEDYLENLIGEGKALIARRGNSVAGFVIIREFDSRSGEISELVSLGGVGRRLLRTVLHSFKQRGCTEVTLEVARGNEKARRLYESEGFEAVDQEGIWTVMAFRGEKTPVF